MDKLRILLLAKEGVIFEINEVSEKVQIIKKKFKRSPESKNIELWGAAIDGYQNKIDKLENELIKIDELITSIATNE